MKYFNKLEDSPELRHGTTQIHYMNKESFRKVSCYASMNENTGVSLQYLSDTHIELGTIALTDLDEIFHCMQGDIWSPNGEARGLIRDKNLHHTSMSCGDVAVVNGIAYMVMGTGFKALP